MESECRLKGGGEVRIKWPSLLVLLGCRCCSNERARASELATLRARAREPELESRDSRARARELELRVELDGES